MTKTTIVAILVLTVSAASSAATPLAEIQRPVVIQLATLAPTGSSWYRTLMDMGAQWQQATSGKVLYRVFADGSMGGESEVILKMHLGRPDAAAISSDGLAEIESGAFALNLPLVFDSYEEWDFVRERVNPILEERLADKGFIVLAWSDIGWVHFFSVEPLRHPDQLVDRKLAASATDQDEIDLLKSLGLNPVPTPALDVVAGLAMGRVDTLYSPIIYVEATGVFRDVKYMTELPWAPLQGAIVVHEDTWSRIAEDHQDAILRISREVGRRARQTNRDHERASLEEMVDRGLTVVEVDDEAIAAWRRLTEDNYDQIRGVLVDAEIFDRVIELRDEYRGSTSISSTDR